MNASATILPLNLLSGSSPTPGCWMIKAGDGRAGWSAATAMKAAVVATMERRAVRIRVTSGETCVAPVRGLDPRQSHTQILHLGTQILKSCVHLSLKALAVIFHQLRQLRESTLEFSVRHIALL